MLVTQPSPPPTLMEGPAPPSDVVNTPANTSNAGAYELDDEDEALQAVLLASLQEEAAQMEGAQLASERAQSEQAARFNSAVKPPLVAAPSPLSALCEESTTSEEVAAGLMALSRPPHQLQLVKVRGDGHCLFRVVGASLVLSAAWGGRAAIDALVEHLSSPLVHEACREAVDILLDLVRERDVLAALNDEEEGGKPARLVAALRSAAVSYMQAHAERFRHCGADGEGEGEDEGEAGWEAYCGAIADSSKRRYGGHPELVALSESLRVRVHIHDTGALSGNIATYHLGEHLPEGCPTIRGLRRGLHFNLLLQAASEGEEEATRMEAEESESANVD